MIQTEEDVPDMAKILIVEDEKAIADIVAFNLGREGFETFTAYDGLEGLAQSLSGQYDLMLLDVMLPGMDGFSICKKLRETSNMPVIMLTAREEEADKVFGLEIGADDYITKPFSMRELLARIRANLRRMDTAPAPAAPKSGADVVIGELEIYSAAHEVRKNGVPLELTAREYDILVYMASRPDTVVTREELMSKVWGYDYYGDLRTVDVAMRRLREKVETTPAEPRYIITRRNMGYLLVTHA